MKTVLLHLARVGGASVAGWYKDWILGLERKFEAVIAGTFALL